MKKTHMKAETILTAIIVLAAAAGGYFLAPGRELALADIILVKAVSLAVFLTAGFAMLYALKGTTYDVLEEIFDENNTAGALFAGLLLVSIALVIGK